MPKRWSVRRVSLLRPAASYWDGPNGIMSSAIFLGGIGPWLHDAYRPLVTVSSRNCSNLWFELVPLVVCTIARCPGLETNGREFRDGSLLAHGRAPAPLGMRWSLWRRQHRCTAADSLV